jgi:peptidyl-prolyl cis-trans isomerase B (cyclophilin B)
MTVLFAGDRIIPPDRKNSRTGKSQSGVKTDRTEKTVRQEKSEWENLTGQEKPSGKPDRTGITNRTEKEENTMIRITMKDGGVIDLELDEKAAPITVENFLKLVNAKFYDGTIFHRVIPGFMIQGGDPEGTGMGGPGWTIKGEFAQNGVNNPIKHKRGVISMARAMDPDSAGSQFFIMHKTSPHLDGEYAAFGKVTEGMEVVEKIATVETDFRDKPLKDQKMVKVTVDTFGVDYPEPEKYGPRR